MDKRYYMLGMGLLLMLYKFFRPNSRSRPIRIGKKGTKTLYIMANFGGPRDSGEIVSFLRALLGDQDVVRTPFPRWFHRGMFGLIAWIRGTFKARKEYATMGEGKGGSPIVGTTEKLATAVRDHSGREILTFHRYNPRTHAAFFKKIHEMDGVGNIRICTLFPQFSYSTVGSIARMFQERLDPRLLARASITRNYGDDPRYIRCMTRKITDKMDEVGGKPLLLFSAHGLPQSFVDKGDTYQKEMYVTMNKIKEMLDLQKRSCTALLAFQSRFGFAKWLQPYTIDVCQRIKDHMQHNETCVLIIPIAFTQDHLETEFEMEHEYMPEIREHGVDVHRINALNVDRDWVEALADIMVDEHMYTDDFSSCIYSWNAEPQRPPVQKSESDEEKTGGSPTRSRL